MICKGTLLRMPQPCVEPSGRGQREQHMLVGTPSHRLSGVLEARVGVVRDLVRNRGIDPGRFDYYEGHWSADEMFSMTNL